jgi:AraC family transcriptional regulator, transcriptional activator of the genes for pyochelin and ferripyochelin receptors
MNPYKSVIESFFAEGDAEITSVNAASRDISAIYTFLNLALTGERAKLFKLNNFVTAEMQIIISQIKNCCLKPPLKDLYINNKINELLLLACNEMENKNNSQPIKLSDYDIECLHEVRSIILNNLDHPYTIRELACKAGINEFKLKKGFKQLFGTSVYNFLRNERMKKSLVMLQKADMSIKEIALELGFPYVSAFTNAFCNKFGYPPTFIRKNKRDI